MGHAAIVSTTRSASANTLTILALWTLVVVVIAVAARRWFLRPTIE
jgi:hypothetical protein